MQHPHSGQAFLQFIRSKVPRRMGRIPKNEAMNILALDTLTIACSVAIQHADQIEYLHKNAPMQQAKLINPTHDQRIARNKPFQS